MVRLLLDQNLSYKLAERLQDVYPGSIHVRDVGYTSATDEAIWHYAAIHGFVIVSKDTDFYQRSVSFGAPPKVVWLRVGDGPTLRIEDLLRHCRKEIDRFVESPTAAFLGLR